MMRSKFCQTNGKWTASYTARSAQCLIRSVTQTFMQCFYLYLSTSASQLGNPGFSILPKDPWTYGEEELRSIQPQQSRTTNMGKHIDIRQTMVPTVFPTAVRLVVARCMSGLTLLPLYTSLK